MIRFGKNDWLSDVINGNHNDTTCENNLYHHRRTLHDMDNKLWSRHINDCWSETEDIKDCKYKTEKDEIKKLLRKVYVNAHGSKIVE